MADFEGEVKAAIGNYEEDMDEDMDEYEKGVKGKEKGKGKGKGMDYMDDDSDDERAQIKSQLNWGGDEVIPEGVDAEEWEKSGQNSTTVLTGIKDVDASVAAIDGSDTDSHKYVFGRGKGPPKQFVMARQQQLLKQQEDVSKKTSVPPPPSSPLPSGGYQKGKGRKKSKRKTKKRKSKRKKRKSKSKRKKRKSKSKRM
jgi:hypothetical protein